MSMIESVRNFICGCPFLAEGAVGVDYLGNANRGYTIEALPSSPILKKYADGGVLKQFVFRFASREVFGEDILKNLENRQFYENFAAWLSEQSGQGNLPVLDEGKRAQKIEALSSGVVASGSAGNARYQIQCRLVYYEN